MANPLVAGPVDVSTPFAGAFLLEDGEALCAAIKSGDWVAGGMAAFSTAADTVAMVSDPLGSLIASGLGWVMEHIEPLKGWMNDLTGDAGEVAGFAGTWTNVYGQMTASADELARVLGDLDGMEGDAIEAYRAFQADAEKHLRAAGTWADAMAVGLQIASTIVKIVHDLVRDAIAQVVGSVVSYAATLVLTAGLATPLVIEQVSTRVASLVGRIGKTITQLLSSGKQLSSLLDKLQVLFKKADDLFGGLLHGKSPEAPTRGPEGSAPRPISDELSNEIIATPKGSRPDPTTYLPPDYIDRQIHLFDDGASRFMTSENFNKYGIGQADGTSFVLPKSEVDALMRETGGDPRAMERALGLPDNYFAEHPVVRVDIPHSGLDGLRLPSGNEAGANPQWLPGGKLPTGTSEGVIDVGGIDPATYGVTKMEN
jgi:hypothetical protein